MHAQQQGRIRRVCVVGSGWRFTSGISYYTCRLTAALSRDADVSVVLMRRLIPRFLYPGRDRVGLRVNRLDYPPGTPVYDGVDWFWLPSMLGAIRFIRRQRPDVLVLQWWTGAVVHSYLFLVLIARRRGAAVVVEFHEVQDTGEARIRGVARYTRLLSTWLFRQADAFVVHSEFDRDVVAKMYPSRRGSAVVVPHGPFDHHLAIGRSERAPASANKSPLTVLFFGTIRPYKGLENLVAAYDALPEDDAERLRLMIVGETWEGWTQPVAAARASVRGERIDIVNRYVDDDEVSDFFSRADAVVLPYLRSSASGPLHIAMAHGLPVVLSDVGGLRDGAAGYEAVTWVPPGDVRALSEALRSLPSLCGRRYADPRSWAHTADLYDAILDKVAPR